MFTGNTIWILTHGHLAFGLIAKFADFNAGGFIKVCALYAWQHSMFFGHSHMSLALGWEPFGVPPLVSVLPSKSFQAVLSMDARLDFANG